MWNKLLDRMLRRLITIGTLDVVWPDGRQDRYGSGEAPTAKVKITDPSAVRALCLRPIVALGEGYTDGTLQVHEDELFDMLTLLARNERRGGMPGWFRGYTFLRGAVGRWMQRNTPLRSQSNVAHHYDISDDLYRLFLDRDMQYSCAYFRDPDMTLEQAQEAKKTYIAAKLQLSPGMRVLDIGCGWGGMALTLARDYGVHVTGVTLSRNQLATAQKRAEEAGLAGMTDFRLLDYRKLDEKFDRIVSVGMLEHVGLPQFSTYFERVAELLAEDGVALIHTIGHSAPPRPTSPWIGKYIFPGGYVPSLSDLAPRIEEAKLWLADIEILRGHYGPTLHHWRARFEEQIDKVREMYDERFVRLWRFYLVACEMAFEEQHQAVFQFQLARQQYAVPRTRDYLYADTRREMMHAAQ